MSEVSKIVKVEEFKKRFKEAIERAKERRANEEVTDEEDMQKFRDMMKRRREAANEKKNASVE